MQIVERLGLGFIASATLLLGVWFAVPDRASAVGPRYVLWKHGVLPFDPSVAYAAMVSDVHRDQLVVGLTLNELRQRFGELHAREEASSDYQKYYSAHFFLDQQVVWLGDSAWLVVVVNGRARTLNLVKG